MEEKKILLISILSVLGLGLFSAYSARPSASATVSATASGPFSLVNSLEDSAENYKMGQYPSWNAIEDTTTAIDNGDLCDIDLSSSEYAGDVLVTLYLTNPDEVVQKYSYWNAKIDAYTTENSGVTSSTSWTSKNIDMWLGLSQGYITFEVPNSGDVNHIDVAIEDGSCYTIDPNAGADPELYLTVQQA